MRIDIVNQTYDQRNISKIMFLSALSNVKAASADSNKKAVKRTATELKSGMEGFIHDVSGKLGSNAANSELLDPAALNSATDSIYNSEIVEEAGAYGEVHILLEASKTRDRNEEIRADNVLKMYFKQIRDIPVLSAEEEYELAKKAYEEDDEKARQTLINSNLKFVVSVAKRYMYRGLPLIDLIQEGNLGLVDAARTFDYKKGFKFISYAVWNIESEIRKALAEKAKTIEVPEYIRSLIYKIKKITAKLTVELGRAPTIYELADKSGMPESKLESILKLSKPIKSLDEPIDSDNDSRKVIDIIPLESGISLRDILETQEENTVYVRALLSRLSPKERGVLTLKYGINQEFPMGIDEIARIYGVSHDRVLKIERRAMKKLKQIVKK